MSAILEAITPWQNKSFRDGVIPLSIAARTIGTPQSRLDPRQGFIASRWMIFDKDMGTVALFVHTIIWDSAGDMETGNFVPDGERAPKFLPEAQIQSSISFKCTLLYRFHTSQEPSLYDHIMDIENHVSQLPNFNKGRFPRNEWQDGKKAKYRKVYTASTQLFTKRTAGRQPKIKHTFHPWLTRATRENTDFEPNPETPRYYDYSDSTLMPLSDSMDPTFHRGDIVVMMFKMGFYIGSKWQSEVIPLEFVRVDKVDPDLLVESEAEPQSYWPESEFAELTLGPTTAPIEVHIGKRKIEQRKTSEDPSDIEDTENVVLRQKLRLDENDTNMDDLMDISQPSSVSSKEDIAQAKRSNRSHKSKSKM